MLDTQSLDELRDGSPDPHSARIRKMWFINSLATQRLEIATANGQLFPARWPARERLAEDDDLIGAVEDTSRLLASYGITGITDATYTNDKTSEALYRRLDLCQRVNLMGDESLSTGSLKIMLDDAALPDLNGLQERIARAHGRGRPVAFHCVTRTELVFALVALRGAGAAAGDRIEHAAVTDGPTLRLLHEVSGDEGHVTVVTQPNFIAERGDQYLEDVPLTDHDTLYRCPEAFLEPDPLAGGTDAPYGDPDPWAAMRAAVDRQTTCGEIIGENETLTPEQALGLFLAPLDSPGGVPRRVIVGAPADFCVLAKRWDEARGSLEAELAARTIRH